MLAKLSSKGQLIIPKAIRRSLGLEPGSEFHVNLVDTKIILEPVSNASPIDQLYGKYSGTDLLDALEREHGLEIHDDQTIRP
jgi:AbrB family looped-hinge helix DNA binding protein